MTAPAFISWVGHGAASLAPPAAFTGVIAHLFAFKADRVAMQRLADTLLNAASDGSVHYEAIAGQSVCTFMDMAQCTSRADAIGWVPGRECALWVPLLETSRAHLLPRLVFWAPYIYIDYSIGLLTGREVWGWSKVGGAIGMPGDAPGAASARAAAFTCSTTLFDPLDPQTRGVTKPLLTVTGSAAARPGAQPAWTDGGEASRQILAHVLGDMADEHVAALRLQPMLPAVAMKQFRDAEDPGQACYQAIVDSPARITRFGGGGVLAAADFTLAITTCASHRIVEDFLGVAPGTGSTSLPIEFAAWLAFDFEALAGRTLVARP